MKAKEVRAVGEYKIFVTFEDGTSGVVDLNDLVQHGIFQSLKVGDAFGKVYTDGTAIAWSDELEIDADNIYAELKHANPSQLLNTPLYHAAD
ncbi:MAG: DUF2442 domain-containing protein [Flavipsychrobacter sp.]|nr:DUF2442 domain-containing protein [Flavipsychrobacter sp.]